MHQRAVADSLDDIRATGFAESEGNTHLKKKKKTLKSQRFELTFLGLLMIIPPLTKPFLKFCRGKFVTGFFFASMGEGLCSILKFQTFYSKTLVQFK